MPNLDYLQELEATTDSHSYYLKLAFLAALMEFRNNQIITDKLEDVLSTRNVDQILQVLNVDELDNLLFGIGMDKDTFIFNDEKRDLFNIGAMAAFSALSLETQKKWNWNPIGERAVSFLLQDSANAALEIVANTKAGVRVLVTRTLAETSDIKQQAREIKQLIGLTENQMQAVLNFKRQLETRSILGVTPPDERRLSVAEQTLIRNHMKNGTMSAEQIESMVGKYYESLLNKRALDIAGTEAFRAVNNGQQQLWDQGLDAGVFDDNIHRKFWRDMGDGKVRPTHRPIAGMNAAGVKIRSMFITPFGLVYGPGDYNSNLINCRCMIFLGTI